MFPWYKKEQAILAPFEFKSKVRVLLIPTPPKTAAGHILVVNKSSNPPLSPFEFKAAVRVLLTSHPAQNRGRSYSRGK